MTNTKRYFVQFTPVGWQVRDSYTGDEAAAYGTGREEYALAKAKADRLNEAEPFFCDYEGTGPHKCDGTPWEHEIDCDMDEDCACTASPGEMSR